MTKPQFSMTFNLGHVVQIVTLIVAMTVGWVQMDARTSSNASRLDTVEDVVSAAEPRIRELERAATRSDERLNSILTLLSRIDSRLERIEARSGR
jgi:hypothetical protein